MNYTAMKERIQVKNLPDGVKETALNYLTDLEDGDQTIEMLEVAASHGDKAAIQVLIEVSNE